MNTQAIKFESLFNSIPEVCEWFNTDWHNGTGYLNALTEEIFDAPVKMRDEGGRKIVVIPLAEGENLVIFQRYTKDPDIAWNAPSRRTSDQSREFHQQTLDGHIMRVNEELPLDRLLKGAQDAYGLEPLSYT